MKIRGKKKFPSEIKRQSVYERPKGELGNFAMLHKATRTLEVDVPKLLKHFGWEDTEANRDIALESIREATKKVFPNMPTSVTTKADN